MCRSEEDCGNGLDLGQRKWLGGFSAQVADVEGGGRGGGCLRAMDWQGDADSSADCSANVLIG